MHPHTVRYRGVGKRACSSSFLEEFFSETQGDGELLLLTAQSILYAIYHSLILFFGELFYRLHRDINSDERFVAYHPAVVPRLDHVRIASTKICLRAIVHNELQLTRNYIPRVAHLAAIGLRNGPYMLGPLPSWLKNLSGDLKVLDGSDLHLALFEFPALIRSVQALSLSACLCHSSSFSFLSRFSGASLGSTELYCGAKRSAAPEPNALFSRIVRN